MAKEKHKLDPRHAYEQDFVEKMTTAQWRDHILAGEDSIIYKGTVCLLVGAHTGFGIVQVSKYNPIDPGKPKHFNGVRVFKGEFAICPDTKDIHCQNCDYYKVGEVEDIDGGCLYGKWENKVGSLRCDHPNAKELMKG